MPHRLRRRARRLALAGVLAAALTGCAAGGGDATAGLQGDAADIGVAAAVAPDPLVELQPYQMLEGRSLPEQTVLIAEAYGDRCGEECVVELVSEGGATRGLLGRLERFDPDADLVVRPDAAQRCRLEEDAGGWRYTVRTDPGLISLNSCVVDLRASGELGSYLAEQYGT